MSLTFFTKNTFSELQNDRLNRNVSDGTISVPELLHQLEQVENEARRLADGLEQVIMYCLTNTS